MMRRTLTVILVSAAVILAMAAPALATHGTGVTYTGPVQAGSELILSCPEWTTAGTAEADFYRDPGMRVPVALNVNPTTYTSSPTGERIVSVTWVVPKGARYADAIVGCFATTSVSLTAQCAFDEASGQLVWTLNWSIINASFTDQSGTLYYRVDEGERQGGWPTTVPGNERVTGSFQLPYDPAERIVQLEYEMTTTTGQVFDSNQVILLPSNCP